MKAYKVEILIVDFDKVGADDIKDLIEQAHYPNHCIHPKVKAIEERDIGEWSNDHPLNRGDTGDEEYRRLFHK